MSEEVVVSAADELRDAISLWWLHPVLSIDEVINAATVCLVAGYDTPTLRELAGASPADPSADIEPLVVGTAAEMGFPTSEPSLVAERAMQAVLHHVELGRLTRRDATEWSKRYLYLEGGAVQPFVTLAYLYDLQDDHEYGGHPADEVDKMFDAEAQAFLAGERSPMRLAAEEAELADRQRGWLARSLARFIRAR